MDGSLKDCSVARIGDFDDRQLPERNPRKEATANATATAWGARCSRASQRRRDAWRKAAGEDAAEQTATRQRAAVPASGRGGVALAI